MTTEQKILEKLSELSELNEISTRHTRAFIEECSRKKSELNDELNSAIIFLFVYCWPVLTNAFILSAYGSGHVSSYLMV